MKCSDKEWQHCNKEKMGCEGCFYNDEISIGEYVRSWNGTIGKVTRIEEGRFLYDNKELICFIASVVKHSKDIKDLFQIGDIITTNNLCGEITKIDGDTIYLANCMKTCNIEDIESIITKEQIKQIEYRIKE